MLGCGTPLGNLKDATHPILLNDVYGWVPYLGGINYRKTDNAFCVGLYEPHAAPPATLPAVKNVADIWSTHGHALAPNSEAGRFYYRSDFITDKDFGPRGQFAYTEFPFPTKPAQTKPAAVTHSTHP